MSTVLLIYFVFPCICVVSHYVGLNYCEVLFLKIIFILVVYCCVVGVNWFEMNVWHEYVFVEILCISLPSFSTFY